MSLDLDEEPSLWLPDPECRAWSDGGLATDQLCAVTEDVVAAHNSSDIVFIFLKTGMSEESLSQLVVKTAFDQVRGA